MSITAVGICGELLLDNKSVGAEKAPAVQVKNVEAQSVKNTAATAESLSATHLLHWP